MSTPRKHHYLPQFYLEGFKIEPQTGKKAHIWQIEKNGNQKHYSPSIEDTGCIRDYHSLDYDDQERDHSTIEKALSNIEGEQATLLKSITESKKFETSQVAELAQFISLMRYRVPSFAKHIETSLRSVVSDSFKIMYQSGAFGTPPDKLRKQIEDKGIDKAIVFSISNWKVLSHMLDVGLSSESISLLSQFNYQIYDAGDRNTFITCDNPVALFHPDYESIKPYGVGLATKDVEITFPLNSNILLRAGINLEPGNFQASTEQVTEFNRRAVIMSESYVFTSKVFPEIKEMLGMYREIYAGFTFDNLFYGNGSAQISRFIPVQ